jgi:hypothetical protein
MDEVYGEPVQVWARADGRPVGFLWRGRRYTVRVIFEHWVVSREWWRDPRGVPAGRGQPELEFWRVEAAPGPGLTAGVYELRREPGTGTSTRTGPGTGPGAGTWTLRRGGPRVTVGEGP